MVNPRPLGGVKVPGVEELGQVGGAVAAVEAVLEVHYDVAGHGDGAGEDGGEHDKTAHGGGGIWFIASISDGSSGHCISIDRSGFRTYCRCGKRLVCCLRCIVGLNGGIVSSGVGRIADGSIGKFSLTSSSDWIY